MKVLKFILLNILLTSCIFAESSWNVNQENIVVMTKLSKIEEKESTSHEYKIINVIISKNGKLERLDELNFLILDTNPKCLNVSPGSISKYGIKKFHFDKDIGLIEIDFNESDPATGIITTTPKLIITRCCPLDDKGLCKERYSCNATLGYLNRLTSEVAKSLDMNELWNIWTKNEYKGVEEIVLPSARLVP